MSNLIASFWQYQSNHPNGKNCERKDPHNFGLDLISYLTYCASSGDYQHPLKNNDIDKVAVIRHTKNASSFGQDITVKAPAEVWTKGREALEVMASEGY